MRRCGRNASRVWATPAKLNSSGLTRAQRWSATVTAWANFRFFLLPPTWRPVIIHMDTNRTVPAVYGSGSEAIAIARGGQIVIDKANLNLG